jgi:hypothetical protein
MSDPMDIAARLGLPSNILHALTPRNPSMHLPPVKAPEKSSSDAGASFQRGDDTTRNADMQLLSELRSLAELHRAHQASGSGSDQSS